MTNALVFLERTVGVQDCVRTDAEFDGSLPAGAYSGFTRRFKHSLTRKLEGY